MTSSSYSEFEYREELLDKTEKYFQEADYDISKVKNSAAVDLIAESKRENAKKNKNSFLPSNVRIFLKVLGNLDAFKDRHSFEMRIHCHLLTGVPLLIASRYANYHHLQDHIIYYRHAVSCININTLKDLLKNNINPSQIAIRGNNEPSVSIDGARLTQYFHSLEGKSQKEICNDLDISRQSLIAYQKERIKPSAHRFDEICKYIARHSKIASVQLIKDELQKKIELNIPRARDFDNLEHQLTEPRNSLQEDINEHLDKLNHQSTNIKLRSSWFQSLPWDGLISFFSLTNKNAPIDYYTQKYENMFTLISETNLDLQKNKQRIDLSSRIFEFLQQHALWLIGEDISTDEELKHKTKYLSIMRTEDFFDIEQPDKLRLHVSKQRSSNMPKS
jgi:predicted transcriptional regulator